MYTKLKKISELISNIATAKYRVRMLQIRGHVLSLYKPALHNGRQETPITKMKIHQMTDFRITHDHRETARVGT